MSRLAFVVPLALAVSSFFGISDQLMNVALQLVWQLPGSRKQEVKTHSNTLSRSGQPAKAILSTSPKRILWV